MRTRLQAKDGAPAGVSRPWAARSAPHGVPEASRDASKPALHRPHHGSTVLLSTRWSRWTIGRARRSRPSSRPSPSAGIPHRARDRAPSSSAPRGAYQIPTPTSPRDSQLRVWSPPSCSAARGARAHLIWPTFLMWPTSASATEIGVPNLPNYVGPFPLNLPTGARRCHRSLRWCASPYRGPTLPAGPSRERRNPASHRGTSGATATQTGRVSAEGSSRRQSACRERAETKQRPAVTRGGRKRRPGQRRPRWRRRRLCG